MSISVYTYTHKYTYIHFYKILFTCRPIAFHLFPPYLQQAVSYCEKHGAVKACTLRAFGTDIRLHSVEKPNSSVISFYDEGLLRQSHKGVSAGTVFDSVIINAALKPRVFSASPSLPMANIYSPSVRLIGVALDVKYRFAIGSHLALMTVKLSRRSYAKQSSAGSAETLVSNYLFKHWDFAFVSVLVFFLLEQRLQPYASIMYKTQTNANQITPIIAFRLPWCSARVIKHVGRL